MNIFQTSMPHITFGNHIRLQWIFGKFNAGINAEMSLNVIIEFFKAPLYFMDSRKYFICFNCIIDFDGIKYNFGGR